MARADDRLSDLASQIARMRDEGKPLRATAFTRPAAVAPKSLATARPELSAVLDLVTRAADLMHAHQDQASRTELRATEAEQRLEAAVRQIADLEERLNAAEDEAERERFRADDMRTRSTEVIEKTQAMLNEASERLLEAEWRAEQADESFATLRDAVETRFAAARA